MEISRVYLVGQLLINLYVIKFLVLLKIQNMIEINVDLRKWFINFFIKSLPTVLLHVRVNLLIKVKLFQINNLHILLI